MIKLYTIWPGSNRFLPCGCIIGPLKDTCANIVFYICAILALIPYCIFILANNWKISPAIPLFLFISLILTTVFLNLTQCTDPGIIPRRPFLQRQPLKYQKYLNGQNNLVLCTTCRIYRPPRASHCSTCQNCVEVFDHHCPFVNNCIGKRNYRFFAFFLGCVVLSIISFFFNVIIFFISKNGSEVNIVIITIICSVAVALVALPLIGFFIFHIYLIITGRTTRELIKSIKSQRNEIQWCQIDPPLIDYFQQLSMTSVQQLEKQLQDIKNLQKKQHAIRNNQNLNQFNSNTVNNNQF